MAAWGLAKSLLTQIGTALGPEAAQTLLRYAAQEIGRNEARQGGETSLSDGLGPLEPILGSVEVLENSTDHVTVVLPLSRLNGSEPYVRPILVGYVEGVLRALRGVRYEGSPAPPSGADAWVFREGRGSVADRARGLA